MSVLKAAQNANTAFSEIPIMSVLTQFIPRLLSCIFVCRDLKDIGDPHADVQLALAKQIRDACIDVGFFYGEECSNVLHRCALICRCSQEPRYLRGNHRARPGVHEDVLCTSSRDQDGGTHPFIWTFQYLSLTPVPARQLKDF